MGGLSATRRAGGVLRTTGGARRASLATTRGAEGVLVPLARTGYRLAYTLLALYWFVVRPQLQGVKCVITDGERVLLVRHTYGPRGWDLPGGGVKRGEAPSVTAQREMEEELGLSITEWTLLGTVLTDAYKRHDTLHCFQADVRQPTLHVNPVEIAATHWFRREELPHHLNRFVRPVLARMDGASGT